jgi:hypothetical protein
MRLIDREALLSFEKSDADLCATCGEHHTAEDVIMMIKTAPTVDAVPVVRCWECKWWQEDDDIGHCDNPDGLDNYAKPDDFCSYGKRKGGAD